MPEKNDLALIGLAVMGQNLALNIARNGYSLAVYNRTPSKTHDILARKSPTDNIFPSFYFHPSTFLYFLLYISKSFIPM